MNFPKLKSDYRDSKDGLNSNILILLHGFGDNSKNFINFALKMELPQTAILSLNAPFPVAFFPECNSWYPAFDSLANPVGFENPAVISGLQMTRKSIDHILVEKVLKSPSNPSGWEPDKVFLLGFGQGGIVAADVLLRTKLGGVISISGLYPVELQKQLEKTISTPILFTVGSAEYEAKLANDQRKFWHKWNNSSSEIYIAHGKGQSMPNSASEMRKIMEFLASKLLLRNPTLESMADLIPIDARDKL